MENSHSSGSQSFSNLPQSPLPNAVAVLVLGILSIVLCFCYGFPGLIAAIIALILAKKDNRLYLANPSFYTPSSFSNLKAGRVCAIIGIILSALYVLCILVLVIFFGVAMFSDPQEFFRQLQQR